MLPEYIELGLFRSFDNEVSLENMGKEVISFTNKITTFLDQKL